MTHQSPEAVVPADEELVFAGHEHGAAALHASIDQATQRWRAGRPVDAWVGAGG